MFQKIVIFSILLLSCSLVKAQYTFTEATDIVVIENDQPLQAALNGGFSNAQLNEIDLNLDGNLDLVVYDRNFGLVKPYLNNGIPDSVSYTYAPEFAYKFPRLDAFLLTRDYNNDGKMDLFSGSFNIVLYENTSNPVDGLGFEKVSTLKTLNNPGRPIIDINPTGSNIPGIYDIDNDRDLDLFINFQSRTIDYHRNLSKDRQENYIPDYERRSLCWGAFLEGENLDGTILDSVYLDTCHRSVRGERLKTPKTQKGLKHGAGLTITPLDIDGNSSTDLLIADVGSYKMKLMLNADSISTNYFTNSSIYQALDSFPKYDTPIHLLFAAAYLIDVNNDGKKDLLVASNQVNSFSAPFSKDDIWFYENISIGNTHTFQLRSKQFLRDQSLDFGRTSKPVFIDYNKDGLKDILVGGGGYLASNDSSLFVEQLALLKNIGTKTKPSFELVNRNYLTLPALHFGFTRNLYAYASPSVGDIDGDGDEDILLTQKNGTIFLFEDTSMTGHEAAFKFHNESFQYIKDRLLIPNGAQLFDIDNDGLQELIVSEIDDISFYPNFGSATKPLFNIPLDSLYWIGGDTMRYYFQDAPNYGMLKFGDSMAVNNGRKNGNNSSNALRIVKIDSSAHFIECINTIAQGVGGNQLDEFSTNAHMTIFNREWKFRTPDNGFSVESAFMFKSKGMNYMLIGAPNGNNFLVENFIDSVQPINSLIATKRDFMTNYGTNTAISGTDLNGDSIIDLVLGFNTGGIKILYGSETTGLENLQIGQQHSSSLFTAFPNPAKGFLRIEILDQIKYQTSIFELRTISGQLVKEGQFTSYQHQLSIDDLKSGLYVLTLRSNTKVESKKLVVRP